MCKIACALLWMIAVLVGGCSVDVGSLQGQHDSGVPPDAAIDAPVGPDVPADVAMTDAPVEDAEQIDAEPADAEPPDAEPPLDAELNDAQPDDAGGSSCGDAASCDDLNDCTLDQCVSDVCQHLALTNQACKGGNGWCYNGACCEGCWDGANCRPGTSSRACGEKGETCNDCGADTSVCQPKVCVPSTASCTVQSANDGTNCSTDCSGLSALCQSGTCRITDASSCMGVIKCVVLGSTCDSSVTPHLCRGGCCDGQICGF